MKRMLLVLSVGVVMTAMVVANAMPAFSAPVKNPNSTQNVTFDCDGQKEQLLLTNVNSAAPAFTAEGRPLIALGAKGTVTPPGEDPIPFEHQFKGQGFGEGELEECTSKYTLEDGTEFDVTVQAFRPPRGGN